MRRYGDKYVTRAVGKAEVRIAKERHLLLNRAISPVTAIASQLSRRSGIDKVVFSTARPRASQAVSPPGEIPEMRGSQSRWRTGPTETSLPGKDGIVTLITSAAAAAAAASAAAEALEAAAAAAAACCFLDLCEAVVGA